ncbi:MAG: HAMP domain-containing methyl-accepting chemotaxis protein [Myxococcales bacterium]
MGTFISIRFKIAALIALLGFALAGLGAAALPRYAASAEREGLEQRAAGAAAMLAGAVSPALEFDQPDTAREILEVAREDRLVRWVAAYSDSGKLAVAVGRGALDRVEKVDSARLLSGDNASIVTLAPSRSQGKVVGAVVVALDSRGIGLREEQTRRAILLQATVLSAVFVLLSIWLSGRMTRVLGKIAAAAERIARGDVTEDFALEHPNDELGKMAHEFVRMAHRLRELQQNAARVAAGDLDVRQTGDGELYVSFRTMVNNLRTLAARIGASSDAVAQAAAALFSATREHEASATQQTASVEEMRRTLESLASSAERVNADAGQVRDMAERSLHSSQQTADQTKLVSTHSDRIGEILTLIQDIADKSDLLALNAALEGTKAGEIGRGFSLVAAEMRRLSEHVVDSVRDIRKLVADMRTASHASVLATEESIKLAKEAATSAGKITSAVGQQREGTSQVKGAAEEIVRVVNTSLDGTAQITRSAESLLQLSHELKDAAKAFRLNAAA